MIDEGCISSEIATRLGFTRPRLSYHIKKAKTSGFLTGAYSGTFKTYELTQPGKNFLAMYQQQHNKEGQRPICRAENVRFKAPVYKMPSIQVDWHKVEMHNWNQYTTEVGSVKVKLNHGDNPTIEFLPSPIDGDDPIKLYCNLILDCNEAAKHLEQTLDMQIGIPELYSKGEWVVYNPLAKAITNTTGRITVDGVGKINASLPNRYGEFEYHYPMAAAQFLEMPGHIARLEQDVDGIKQDMKEILNLIKQEKSSEDNSDGIIAEGENA